MPDQRTSGWWTTNIVAYTGARNKDDKTEEEIHTSIFEYIKKFLNVYYRYRIYVDEEGTLMFSVKEEDVNNVVDDMFNFRLQSPRPEHFNCTHIAVENAPFLREMESELHDLLHDQDVKYDLETRSKTLEEYSRMNYTGSMVNSILKRILTDHRKPADRVMFMKTVIYKIFASPCKCNAHCIWRQFQNVGVLQKMLDDLNFQNTKEKAATFGPNFPMTRKEMEKRLRKNKIAVLKAMQMEIEAHKFNDDLDDARDEITIHQQNDNVAIPSKDILKARGLYLSHSRTYTDWIDESKRPKVEEPTFDSLEGLQDETNEENITDTEEHSENKQSSEMVESNTEMSPEAIHNGKEREILPPANRQQ